MTPEPQTKIDNLSENIRKNIAEFIRSHVQDSLATKLETIPKSDYNINNDIKDTADKMISQLADDTNHIANKINSALREIKILETIEKINNKLIALEDKNTAMDENIQKLFNNTVDITEQIQNCGVVNNKEGSNTEPTENPEVNKEPVCSPKVPASIKTKSDIWINREKPQMDDLDMYLSTNMSND